ncbi:hypothetical protein FRUB_05493 [Fimbriiglobus ruber]|uniref:Uncharacterized protein n=1 Tax=Fimbriiglobus ruber TaxID=1908690 RepID=A0A225DLS8_9BACT|nr:hypothetical protein FRUB_05493 [Fimbriiglobus ruber]
MRPTPERVRVSWKKSCEWRWFGSAAHADDQASRSFRFDTHN